MECTLPHNLLSFLIFVCIASAAFRTIGLIIAAVVNSTQESNILIQPIYMVMLFFSGATIPISFFPDWLQLVTQFVPATYVVIGLSGILQRGETLAQNSLSVLVLIITAFVGIFIATKLVSLGERGKTARLGQALGLDRVAAVLLSRRLSGMEPAGPNEERKSSNANARAAAVG